MLGLYHGQRGARLWRQVWSDHRLKPLPPREVWERARQAFVELEVGKVDDSEMAVVQSRADIVAGRFVQESPEAHLARLSAM
jgi:hypothetical protein